MNFSLFQKQQGNIKASTALSDRLMEYHCTDIYFENEIFLLVVSFFVTQGNGRDRNVRPRFCPHVSLA